MRDFHKTTRSLKPKSRFSTKLIPKVNIFFATTVLTLNLIYLKTKVAIALVPGLAVNYTDRARHRSILSTTTTTLDKCK